MKLLIDANVLLDVLQNRKPHVRQSSIIWKLCETNQVQGFVSALTFANLVYVMRKELDPQEIEELLNQLSLIFEFTELTAFDLKRAAELGWDDYEDAIQSVTAHRLQADYIITRNVRDFTKSEVQACMPKDFIEKISEMWS